MFTPVRITVLRGENPKRPVCARDADNQMPDCGSSATSASAASDQSDQTTLSVRTSVDCGATVSCTAQLVQTPSMKVSAAPGAIVAFDALEGFGRPAARCKKLARLKRPFGARRSSTALCFGRKVSI